MADFLCSVCRIISGIQDRFEPKPKKECIQSTMLPSARRASPFVHCKKKLSSDTNHKRKRGSGSELKHPGSSTLIVWNYSDYYGFWLLIHKVSCDRAGMANECGSANNQLQKPFCGQPKVSILSLSRPGTGNPHSRGTHARENPQDIFHDLQYRLTIWQASELDFVPFFANNNVF